MRLRRFVGSIPFILFLIALRLFRFYLSLVQFCRFIRSKPSSSAALLRCIQIFVVEVLVEAGFCKNYLLLFVQCDVLRLFDRFNLSGFPVLDCFDFYLLFVVLYLFFIKFFVEIWDLMSWHESP